MAAALLGATAWHLLGHRPLLVGAVAGAAGLLTAYTVTGLARAQLGVDQAAAARYVYTAAPFILLMLGAWLGTLAPLEVRRSRVALTVVVFLALALTANLAQLRWWQQHFLDRADETRAAIAVVLRHGGSPAIPADRAPAGTPDLQIDNLPAPDRLRELIDRFGSPMDDPLSEAAGPSAELEERALLRLVDHAFLVATADGLPGTSTLPTIIEPANVSLASEGSCVRVTSLGPGASVGARVANGGVLHVRPDAGGVLGVQLARSETSSAALARSVDVPAGAVAEVRTPELGDDTGWLVRLDLPTGASSLVCAPVGP